MSGISVALNRDFLLFISPLITQKLNIGSAPFNSAPRAGLEGLLFLAPGIIAGFFSRQEHLMKPQPGALLARTGVTPGRPAWSGLDLDFPGGILICGECTGLSNLLHMAPPPLIKARPIAAFSSRWRYSLQSNWADPGICYDADHRAFVPPPLYSLLYR